ncbi:MAG TPA: SRPBCC domain-containing protein [Allosphingosinicella sp.]|nr:SRPBCC domain-containing protein [Allosphingosinicella sp.]
MIAILALALAAQAPAQPPALRAGLEPLGFLVGHCWRGEFEATGERDTHCFESVYDGQHVRDRHEVTGGARVYRGETVYSADSSGAVSYTYWNSLGGVSRGTMRPGPERLDFGDESYRGPDGRETTISTFWRRIGDDSYEAVSASPTSQSMNRTVRYRRVVPEVSIATSRGADGSHALAHEVLVDAPASEVWAAVATAPGWTSWAVPVAWSEGDLLETSYSPGASRGDRTTIQQRIVARVEGRLIAFRTVKAPDGFPHFETFREVTHLLELEPAGDGRTRVRLTGTGYADSEAGRRLLDFFREGNRVSLDRLRRRFASGPIDWTREQH